MSDFLLAASDTVHRNALLLVGLAITGGALGAVIFRRIRFPQVIGYIIIGYHLRAVVAPGDRSAHP